MKFKRQKTSCTELKTIKVGSYEVREYGNEGSVRQQHKKKKNNQDD